MKTITKVLNHKVIMLVTLVMMLFTFAACTPSNEVPTDAIQVTSIVVSGADNKTTITELEGTLQMSVVVLPADAFDKSVTWSVVNTTGSATISATGLLKAVSNGTVTVTATSKSNINVYGSKVITLSNQAAADMDATLTDLKVAGTSVLDFNPLNETYTHMISEGVTVTPTVTVVKYSAAATVVITPASDVTSSNILNRTTVIQVTNGSTVKTYKVVFETQITPVNLGTAGDYAILAQTGISTATTSDITGDIAVSPSPASYITGFSLTMDSTGTFATSSQVTGKVFASDYTTPTPSKLTTAISDMLIAYADASGRAANYTELYSGDLSGKTLTPGVYKFSSSVLINTALTLTGSATDVWIFQISGQLTMASDIQITLAGGADAKNIVWQVADTVAIGSGAHFEGTILAMTDISMGTNSSINGRLYAQTAVTLDATTMVKSND
ncbi:MAG: ice-binding family protein [Acholeplasmataceae bacterium]|nr:ice-binding family protein [Acholeplasmataceae bacterium]